MKDLKITTSAFLRKIFCCLGAVVLFAGMTLPAWTQEKVEMTRDQVDRLTAAIQDLQQQVQELQSAVVEVRSEAADYRAETAELRRELQAAQTSEIPAPPDILDRSQPQETPASSGSASSSKSVEQRITSLEDSQVLLTDKVDEQHQTKVESASKYRMRLSGIVLMNLFNNRGTVDNEDVPSYATPAGSYGSNGSFGATLRQSEIGLEVFGPDLAGARTSGNVALDFSGGFPSTLNGVDYGLARLRIASLRLDWTDSSIVAGQDNLFFSPLSPSSFASLSVPALSYSGNLWGWIPQVRIEHRFNLADNQEFSVQGGILDNLSGETPYSQFNRYPQSGESTGQPAYASRVAWTRALHDRPLSFGAAGFYSRQDWSFGRRADGWASMADWSLPMPFRFSLTGEIYRGRAIGALGGGIGQSVVYSGEPAYPSTQIRALNSAGGWSQLKFQATSKLELNAAFGLDNPFARDVEAYPRGTTVYGPILAQNRSGLFNFIYRPRSNVLFSGEYRRLRTLEIYDNQYSAEQFNLMMGVLF